MTKAPIEFALSARSNSPGDNNGGPASADITGGGSRSKSHVSTAGLERDRAEKARSRAAGSRRHD
jgi:hypothetical protein